MSHSILIIYTGGTIGMKTNPETGALAPFNFDQIETEVPELKKFGIGIDTLTFSPLIDSSNITPDEWVRMATVIKEHYYKYDGFVVLHGTDTMSYSASALSFMVQNLDKPVIFTGSQIPIGVPRTDGKENLITSVEIAAAKGSDGKPLVPEVCVYFENHLFRGNRTSKYSADHFNAFRSYNYPPLAEAGIDIKYNLPYIRKMDAFLPSFDITTELSPYVAVLKLYPGISRTIVRGILANPEVKGVVMETFGSGNAPMYEWFLDEIREAIKRGVIILNTTQCSVGTVNMEIYDTGKALKSIGVVSGGDMTVEAAITKMMYLLGKNLDKEQLIHQLSAPIRGEMTHPGI